MSKEPTEDYLAAHPEDTALNPYSCATHAAVGTHRVPLRFDRQVPIPLVESWRFLSTKGKPRPLRNKEGLVKNTTALQGVYLLAPETERALLSTLARE